MKRKRPWWERRPGVDADEIAAFAQHGIVVEATRTSHGVMERDVVVPVAGYGDVPLTVTYPDSFPLFRPEVRVRGAMEDEVGRHIHPFGGGLCLLGRVADEWWPTDTTADVLVAQLPKVMATAYGDNATAEPTDAIRAQEQHQAEPFSAFYSCYAAGAILLDSHWTMAGQSGRMQLALRVTPSTEAGRYAFNGSVLAAATNSGGRVPTVNGITVERFAERLAVPWFRLEAPIAANSPLAIADALERELAAREHRPENLSRPWPAVLANAPAITLRFGERVVEVRAVAVGFPEERAHRDGAGADGWIFLVATREIPRSPRPGGRLREPIERVHLVRAAYTGVDDLAERVPETRGLRDKHVALFGLGAVGSPIAELLIRSGVGTLSVIDYDVFDPATLPRHTASIEYGGWPKVEFMFDRARTLNPYVTIKPYLHQLGHVRQPGTGRSESDVLQEILDGVDLIIDATAARTSTVLLADEAAERNIPLIDASTTGGAWGGRVIRIRPGVTPGCYYCLMRLVLAEDQVREQARSSGMPLPGRGYVPPADSGEVQPAGCAEPTFTGSGFDITEVAAHATRVAVATLQAGGQGYPDFVDDVFVLALRDDNGRPIPAKWTGLPLPIHPGCPQHDAP